MDSILRTMGVMWEYTPGEMHVLGAGRKPENLKEPHTDMNRISTQTVTQMMEL